MLTFVDFGHYGIDHPVPVDSEELEAIWYGARTMLANTRAESLRKLIEHWELALNYTALTDSVIEDEWYTRALLCIALSGSLGDRAPRFYSGTQWD